MKKISKNNKILMVPFKKLLIPVVALIVLGAVATAAYLKYGVVAVVNGRRIGRVEYTKMMEKQVGKQVLDQLVTEEMILSEAQKEGVVVSQEDIDKEIGSIEEDIKAQGKTLEEALVAEGMEKSDLERQILIRLLVEKMVSKTGEVSEEEIASFLEENEGMLPTDVSEEELNQLAKDQISSQKDNEMINSWISELEAKSTVVYR